MHLCCQCWVMACNVLRPSDGQQRPIVLRPHMVFGCHIHKHTYTYMHSFELCTEIILRYNTVALVFLSLKVLHLVYLNLTQRLCQGVLRDSAEFALREDAREEKSKFLFLDVPANLCGQGTLRWPESLSRCFTWRTRTTGASHMWNKADHLLT